MPTPLRPFSRRQFLRTAAAAASAASLVPGVKAQPATPPKTSAARLNIACIGVHGMGYPAVLESLKSENVVALCDVDLSLQALAIKEATDAGFPEIQKARCFQDYREMFAEMAEKIDAVTVCTPDHHHFPAAMLAIKHRKYVFVQKPLTHTVAEARALKAAAKAAGVITQMGNQYHASEGIRLVREWFELGLLGEVREVVAWVPGNASRFLYRPASFPPAPGFIDVYFDWKTWLGPAAERDFAPGCYHPKRWRGWWDFGTGLLGDWACHTIDAPFWALQLGAPISVEAEVSELHPEFVPKQSTVRYEFPARGKLPPVKLTWHEGGAKPAKPAGWDEGELPAAGMLMIGSRNTLFHGSNPDSPRLVESAAWEQLKRDRPKKWLPRVEGGHFAEWFRGCKGEGPAPGSSFDYSADLTQVALLGVVAMRSGKRLAWDNAAGRVVNDAELQQHIEIRARDGWKFQ